MWGFCINDGEFDDIVDNVKFFNCCFLSDKGYN